MKNHFRIYILYAYVLAQIPEIAKKKNNISEESQPEVYDKFEVARSVVPQP